jgi:hypothetical protein
MQSPGKTTGWLMTQQSVILVDLEQGTSEKHPLRTRIARNSRDAFHTDHLKLQPLLVEALCSSGTVDKMIPLVNTLL